MLYDAHNHLQDARLAAWRAAEMASFAQRCGVAGVVVNGTAEADWPAVAELARGFAWVRPSFGLHPWQVKARGPEWLARLREWLGLFPHAVVGEIGLDRWIEAPDVEAQRECFRAQMALAVELERPVTIHCLRAWGLLMEELRALQLPGRGFLLHSYGGPVELVPELVRLGAYFSLSPYFGHARKAAQRGVFAAVPRERLLAETDAPEMWPPEELNAHPLTVAGLTVNDPANLAVSYALLAEVQGLPVAELEAQVGENYRRLFG
jgi:TatD DNase family protein